MESAPLLSLRFNPEADLLAATRDCEAEVFLRVYGNTRQQLEDEYGPYEDASVFIALADDSGDVVGACRLIRPSELGLKSLDDAARPPWSLDVARSARAARLDLTQTWDVATLGCRRGLKGPGRLASAALFHALVQVVRANEIRSAVMIIDERVRALLASAGMTGHTLPGARPARYLGSAASTPVYRHCDEAFDQQRIRNPDAHRLFTHGIGLDGIRVPPLAEFRFVERAGVLSARSAQVVGASL
ncbi:MAG TPA: hypothetical protein VF714_06370 [Jatrophihabitans sp.]|jgi:hypothetical protein